MISFVIDPNVPSLTGSFSGNNPAAIGGPAIELVAGGKIEIGKYS